MTVAPVASQAQMKWIHRMALVATGATFLLLVAGATVTSLDVGMADTEWPTPPWYLVALVAGGRALDRGLGFLIEHAHRQVGWIVGMLIIAMTALAWTRSMPRWIRWWTAGLLVAVSVQGILGGVRVLVVSRELAVVHGILAHLFFSACVLTVSLTRARPVREPVDWGMDLTAAYQRLRTAALAVGLLLFQVVTGTVLRHLGVGLGVHVLGAVAAALVTMGLGFGCFFLGDRPLFGFRAWFLMLGAFGQVLLGAASWLSASGFGPYAVGPVTRAHAYSATAHMLLGSALLAAAATLVVDLYGVWSQLRAETRAEAASPAGAVS